MFLLQIWSDEFSPCSNATCNTKYGGIRNSNWWFMTGDGRGYWNPAGWGNNERECYMDDASVASVISNPDAAGDGMLRITATHVSKGFSCSNAQGPDGAPHESSKRFWKSAKLVSQGLRTFMWGGTASRAQPIEIEARMRVPMGACMDEVCMHRTA